MSGLSSEPIEPTDPVVIDALKTKISVLENSLKTSDAKVESQRKVIEQLRKEIKTQDQTDEDIAREQKFEALCDKVYEFMGW